jgi:pimeloyl-ACP methyl ester carboxylesterase
MSELATKDFGGDGPPVLLLPGGGAEVSAMTPLAEALLDRHRVFGVDLPGHGRSPDADWDWDAAIAAIDDVVLANGLGTPIVVGHSLGGMLATLWADTHPDCPAAVSLDGNPTVRGPEQLPGLADADAEFARLQAAFDAMEAAMKEAADRGTRPSATLLTQLRRAMAELDLTPVYARLRVPLLLVLATEDLPQQQPFHALYAAHRAFLRNQATKAARDNPLLTVEPLAGATHASAITEPARIAELIATFVATA